MRLLAAAVVLLLFAALPAAQSLTPATASWRDAVSCEPGAARSFTVTEGSAVGHVAVLCDTPAPTVTPNGNDCGSPLFLHTGWSWGRPFVATLDARGSGLDADRLLAAFDRAGQAWDATVPEALWGGVSLGGDIANADRRDGVNQMGFDRMEPGVVAVTITWTDADEISAVESDAIYNTRFSWGLDGERRRMDVENVAAHELGHTFGLDHPLEAPGAACLTMYAYVDEGETQKRSLGYGDELGLVTVYARPER